MRTKNSNQHAVKGSTAFKPFMTEYRVSYKDPAPTLGKYSTIRDSNRAHHELKKPSTAAPSLGRGDKPKTFNDGITLPPLPQPRSASASSPSDAIPSTSLTLPGMVNGGGSEKKHTRRRRILEASAPATGTPVRYNIITGSVIDGEPSSGFKEGRRAFVRTFAHFDAVTNARTPGYNIITGRDTVGYRQPQQQQQPLLTH